jgi:hypothetical protein
MNNEPKLLAYEYPEDGQAFQQHVLLLRKNLLVPPLQLVFKNLHIISRELLFFLRR